LSESTKLCLLLESSISKYHYFFTNCIASLFGLTNIAIVNFELFVLECFTQLLGERNMLKGSDYRVHKSSLWVLSSTSQFRGCCRREKPDQQSL